jgi:hypothetical protein
VVVAIVEVVVVMVAAAAVALVAHPAASDSVWVLKRQATGLKRLGWIDWVEATGF